jgi:hypothetical protein
MKRKGLIHEWIHEEMLVRRPVERSAWFISLPVRAVERYCTSRPLEPATLDFHIIEHRGFCPLFSDRRCLISHQPPPAPAPPSAICHRRVHYYLNLSANAFSPEGEAD